MNSRLALERLEDRQLLSTCRVTRLSDMGAGMGLRGDLRYCINKVNAEPGADIILIHRTGTIKLTGALPALSTDMEIVGPGSDVLRVRRNSGEDYRVFDVTAGAVVRISGLTATNGRLTSAHGGGIRNLGSLTLVDMRVTSNRGRQGGGIFNSGNLLIQGSVVSGNFSTFGRGGGIFNERLGSSITIEHSSIVLNISDPGYDHAAHGGGIYNGGSALIKYSTIANNTVKMYGVGAYSVGGGIFSASSARLTITNSTISGNVAEGTCDGEVGAAWGGGISAEGTVSIEGSTIANNSLDLYCNYAYLEGGGIRTSGSASITHSTIAGNDVSGIHNASTLTLRNSVVANNLGQDLNGSITSSGYNLIGNSAGGSGYIPSDMLDVDPLLGSLAGNGGPTQTMALLPGSPAIDSGTNHMAPEWDQRGPGFPRIVNDTIDIGAFEVQATGAPSPHGRASVLALATSDALKGRDITAQGNALGNEAIFASALKGRDNRTAEYGVSIAPLQDLVHRATFQPRALPWADLFRPVGAEAELKIFS